MRVNESFIPKKASIRLKPKLTAEARIGLYGVAYVLRACRSFVAHDLQADWQIINAINLQHLMQALLSVSAQVQNCYGGNGQLL